MIDGLIRRDLTPDPGVAVGEARQNCSRPIEQRQRRALRQLGAREALLELIEPDRGSGDAGDRSGGIDQRVGHDDGRLAGSGADLIVADRRGPVLHDPLEPGPPASVRQQIRIDRRGGAEKRAVGVGNGQVEVPRMVAQDPGQELDARPRIVAVQGRHPGDCQEQPPGALQYGGLFGRREPGQAKIIGDGTRPGAAPLLRLGVDDGRTDGQHRHQGDDEQAGAKTGTERVHDSAGSRREVELRHQPVVAAGADAM